MSFFVWAKDAGETSYVGVSRQSTHPKSWKCVHASIGGSPIDDPVESGPSKDYGQPVLTYTENIGFVLSIEIERGKQNRFESIDVPRFIKDDRNTMHRETSPSSATVGFSFFRLPQVAMRREK